MKKGLFKGKAASTRTENIESEMAEMRTNNATEPRGRVNGMLLLVKSEDTNAWRANV